MKVKKPSEQSVKDTIALAGGVVVGQMASKGLFGLVHTPLPSGSVDAAAIKKDENTAMLKRAGILLLGGALAASLVGNDAATTAARGAATGLAVAQGLDLIAQLAKKSNVTPEASATTAAQKFLARAVGLGCPCTGEPAGLGWQMPRYEMSIEDQYATVDNGMSFNSGNIFEMAATTNLLSA